MKRKAAQLPLLPPGPVVPGCVGGCAWCGKPIGRERVEDWDTGVPRRWHPRCYKPDRKALLGGR